MSQGLPEMLVPDLSRPLRERQPEQRPRRTRRQTVTVLAGVPLFTGFSKRDLQRLADQTDEQVFTAGQTVVEEGLLGETLFVVLSGQARVVRGRRRVGRVMPGDFFGELSALDGGPRSASVVAETPLTVLRVFRRTLMAMIEAEPRLAMKLVDGIVRRLREVERTLTA